MLEGEDHVKGNKLTRIRLARHVLQAMDDLCLRFPAAVDWEFIVGRNQIDLVVSERAWVCCEMAAWRTAIEIGGSRAFEASVTCGRVAYDKVHHEPAASNRDPDLLAD